VQAQGQRLQVVTFAEVGRLDVRYLFIVTQPHFHALCFYLLLSLLHGLHTGQLSANLQLVQNYLKMHCRLVLAALAAAQLTLSAPVAAPEALETREEGIYNARSLQICYQYLI
jgi:hypothetical protein